MKEITITKLQENQRLDKFLLKYFNKAPKSLIYKLLRKKRIKYNGGKAEGGEMLKEGDSLQFYLAEETMDTFMEVKKVCSVKQSFQVLYEDENFLFVQKPAGVLTQPEKKETTDSLVQQIQSYLYEKGEYSPSKFSTFAPAVCNRLDRNTSGMVIAGKNSAALRAMNEAIAQKKVDKFYLTIVKGVVTKERREEAYFTKEGEKNQVLVTKEPQKVSGKMITEYIPLKNNGQFTLLQIKLITGKSHQIRAHLSFLGYPVIGDGKYGNQAVNLRLKKEFGLSYQLLHAYKIVIHEKTGLLGYLAEKEFVSPLPPLFEKIEKTWFL